MGDSVPRRWDLGSALLAPQQQQPARTPPILTSSAFQSKGSLRAPEGGTETWAQGRRGGGRGSGNGRRKGSLPRREAVEGVGAEWEAGWSLEGSALGGAGPGLLHGPLADPADPGAPGACPVCPPQGTCPSRP